MEASGKVSPKRFFIMLGKEFESYFVRCRKCGKGKPKDSFRGSINRVCLDCRGAHEL